MAADGSITQPRPVAVVPVSDYAKFIEQFGGDGSETITAVTVGDQQILAGPIERCLVDKTEKMQLLRVVGIHLLQLDRR